MAAAQTDIEALVAAHTSSQKYEDRKKTGGIFPFCVDPAEGKTYLLLGLNGARQYCHFHGWIDAGETHEQGAAREGWEESKGLLGNLLDLWRALMLRAENFSVAFVQSSFLVNLGEFDAARRARWVARFDKMPAFYRCMREVGSVAWVDAAALREACLQATAAGYTRDGSPVIGRDIKVPGFLPDTTLRPFVQEWFCCEHGPAVWASSLVESIFVRGEPGPLRPITEMPKLSPPDRKRLLALLKIPTCGKCNSGEGHVTAVCPSAGRRSVSSGTLRFGTFDPTSPFGAQPPVASTVGKQGAAVIRAYVTLDPMPDVNEAEDYFYFVPYVDGLVWQRWVASQLGIAVEAAAIPVRFRGHMINIEHCTAIEIVLRDAAPGEDEKRVAFFAAQQPVMVPVPPSFELVPVTSIATNNASYHLLQFGFPAQRCPYKNCKRLEKCNYLHVLSDASTPQ